MYHALNLDPPGKMAVNVAVAVKVAVKVVEVMVAVTAVVMVAVMAVVMVVAMVMLMMVLKVTVEIVGGMRGAERLAGKVTQLRLRIEFVQCNRLHWLFVRYDAFCVASFLHNTYHTHLHPLEWSHFHLN